ncbi:MAG: autotransporter-associated beta strand repeat-containing protein [Planctomycetaceae bacterium]
MVRRTSVGVRTRGKLRVTKLEERKLLDAGFGLDAAGILQLDGFDTGDTLNLSGDFSNGSGSLTLEHGIWDAVQLNPGFVLSNGGSTLNVTSAVTGIEIRSDDPINTVSSGSGIQVASLTIANAGQVMLNSTTNDFDSLTISADSVSVSDIDDLTLHDISATSQITVQSGGDLFVDSDAAIISHSGSVVLDAGSAGTVWMSGHIDASSELGQGGTVHLLGDRIALTEHASIDASGETGGGEVLIGGDVQGSNPHIANSSQTYVGSEVLINASAGSHGDGGKVVVWANESTQFYGQIHARGGLESGDGGFVETSGKDILDLSGTVDAHADHGAAGEWLLDPRNVSISDNPEAGGGFAADVFTPNADDANVNASDLVAALTSGTSVTVLTGATGSQDGNLSVDSQLLLDSSHPDVTLTLQAANSIAINAPIISADGLLNLVLNANSLAGGSNDDLDPLAGNVLINALIFTNGGTFSSTGVNFDNTGGAIQTGAGSVTISHSGTVTIGTAITTSNSTGSAVDIDGNGIVIDAAVSTGSQGLVDYDAGTGAISGTGTTSALSLNLTAATGIGSSSALQTQVTNIAFNNAANATNISNTGALVIAQLGTATTSAFGDGGTISASSPLTVNAAVSSAGDFTLEAGGGSGAATDDLIINVDVTHSAGGTINLRAGDDVVLAAGTVSSAGGIVNITADTENNSDGGITQTSGNISTGQLNLVSSTAVSLTNGTNASDTLTANVTSADESLAYADADGFAIGSSGVVTNGGVVSLKASAADSAITSVAGADIDTTNSGSSATGAVVTLVMDQLSLGGTLNAGSGGLVTFRTASESDQGIQIGAGAVDDADWLGISDAELDNVITGTGVTIGSAAQTANIEFVGAADQATAATITGGTFLVETGGTGEILIQSSAAITNDIATTLRTDLGEIVFAGGTLTTIDDTILLQGAVRLAGNALISTGSGSGDVVFEQSVNADDSTAANRTLAVTAGTGTVQFASGVGDNLGGQLADLDIAAALVRFSAGTVRIDDNNSPTATATLAGNVQLDGDVEFDMKKDGGVDNSLTITGSVNADSAANDRILTIASGTGSVAIQGIVGGSEALESLSINESSGSGSIAISDLGTAVANGVVGSTAVGNVSTTGIVFSGTVYTTAGTQTYTAAAGNNLVVSGGNTEFRSEATADALVFANSVISLSGNQLTVDLATATATGSAVGATGSGGSLVIAGNSRSTFSLTGSSSYTGNTTVSSGTLALVSSASNNNIAGSSVIQVATGAFLDVTGLDGADGADTLTIAGTQTLKGTGTVTGNVLNEGIVAPGNSPGILTITGNFTSTGALQFEANSPWTTAGTDFDQLAVGGSVDLNGATLTFSNSSDTAAPNTFQVLTLISNSGMADLTTHVGASVADGGTVTVGSRSFRLFYNGGDGNDVLLVDATQPTTVYVEDTDWSSFTPGTFIGDADQGTAGDQAAILGVNAFTSISAAEAAVTNSGTIIVNDGTYSETVSLSGTKTLIITGPDAAAAVAVDDLAAAAGTLITVHSGSSLTFGDSDNRSIAAVISGNGTLVKAGSGTVTLSGANTFTNTLTINAGTIAVGNTSALGTTGGSTIVNGGTLDLAGTAVGAEVVSISGSGVGAAGALINSSGTAASLAGNVTLAADATVGGSGRIVFSGTVNGTTADSESLTLTGTGSKQFTTTIGGSTSLKSLVQNDATGAVQFDDDVTIGSGGATFRSNVTLDGMTLSSAGSVTVGNAASDLLTIASAATTITTSAGDIVLNSATTSGQNLNLESSGGITFSAGVAMAADTNLTATSTGSTSGIQLNSSAADLSATGSGTITLTSARDISVAGGASITTVNGAIDLNANQQAIATTGNFIGVNISGGLVQATGSGVVTVAGRAGNDAGGSQIGVRVSGQIIGGTAGQTSVTGFGGSLAGTGGLNDGVLVTGTGAAISSGGSHVLVTGTGGGSGTGNENNGVSVVFAGQISAGGSGTVSVIGSGGGLNGTGINNYGVFVGRSNSLITSSGGDVVVTGTGGQSSQGNSIGVAVGLGGTISSGSGKNVAISGTGGGVGGSGNFGVLLYGTGSTVTSGGGDVLVTGTAGTGFSFGVEIMDSSQITTVANSGTVTLVTNSLDIRNGGSVAAQTGSSVNLVQKTDGVAISLGGSDSAGTLGLSATELSSISAGTLNIGNSHSGNISSSAAVTLLPANVQTLHLTTGGSILDTNAAGPDITVTNLAIDAVTGIADSTTLETAVSKLAFHNATSGNVAISNTGALTIDSVAGITTSSNDAADGSVALTAASPITFAVNTTSGGQLTAVSTESAVVNTDNITVNSGVTVKSTGGDVVLRAGDRIAINSSATVQSVAGSVVLVSGFGDTDDDGAQVLDGSIQAATSVTIDLSAENGTAAQASSGAITAGNLQLLSSGNGSFALGSSSGNSVSVLAASVGGDLTYANAASMQVGTVTAASVTTIGITATGTTAKIDVSATGTLTVANSITGPAEISLTAEGATSDIAVNASVSSIVGDVSLNADRDVNVLSSGQVTTGGSGIVDVTSARTILIDGGSVQTNSGDLTLNANQQAVATSGNFIGINVLNSAVVQTTSGNIVLSGRGGDTGHGNDGIAVQSSSVVRSTGPGAVGGVTLTGTGGSGTDGNSGVRLTGGEVISLDGAIQIVGTASALTNGNMNDGVRIESGGRVESQDGGSATISIEGTGGGGDSLNRGVVIQTSGTEVTSKDGAIAIVGHGGTGTGADNFGVLLWDGGQAISRSGGTADVTFTGNSATAAGLVVAAQISSSGTGNVTLIADDIDISNAPSDGNIDAANNVVSIRQLTNGVAIDLGGADASGILGLTDAELNAVTAGTLSIGNAVSGSITVSSVMNVANNSVAVPVLKLTTGDSVVGTGTLLAETILLDAVSGIGTTGSPLHTVAGTLAAVNSTSGDVAVSNMGTLTLGTGGSGITNSAAGGAIQIETTGAGSDLLIAETISGSGVISLTAADQIRFDQSTGTTGIITTGAGALGAVTLSAGGSVVGNADAATDVNAASLNVTAGSGIGSSDALQTIVSILNISNTTGSVRFENTQATGITFNGSGGTGQVSLVETVGAILVDSSLSAGSLILNAADSITDGTDGDISVTGNADFTGSLVQLGDDSGNATNFGTLSFHSAGDVGIIEDSSMVLTGTNSAGELTLISAGSVTDTAGTSVDVAIGDAFISGTQITLADSATDVLTVAGNLFANGGAGSIDVGLGGTATFGTLKFQTTDGIVRIREADATELRGTSTADQLTLVSGGAVTDANDTSLTVDNGDASITGTSIVLADQVANGLNVSGTAILNGGTGIISIGAPGTVNFGSLNFNTTDTVTITEDSGTDVVGSNSADSLALSSAGNISLTGTTTVDSTAVMNSSGSINGAGLFTANTVDLNAVSGIGNSTTVQLDASVITADTTGGQVVLNNSHATAVTLSSLTTGSGSVEFEQSGGGDLTTGTISATTSAIITNTDAGIALDGSVTSSSLQVTAQLAITDGTAGYLSISGHASFSGSSITLGNDAGNTTNFGDLTFSSTGAVSISEDSDTEVVNAATAAGLILNSSGNIDLTGTTSVDTSAEITAGGSINGSGLLTATTVDLDAGTGIGNSTAVQTASTGISADTATGAIDIDNTVASATTVSSLTTGSGSIDFGQTGGGDVDLTGPVTSGNPANGGSITLTAANELTVSGSVSSAGGSGGTLAIGGAAINGQVTVGAGSVSIQGGGIDLIINAAMTADNDVILSSARDVIISAVVDANSGGSITVTADNNSATDTGSGPTDGHGGVHISAAGRLDAEGDVTVTGSDLFSTSNVDSVLIDSDGANAQVLSGGNIIIGDGSNAPSEAAVVIHGVVRTTGTSSTIDITSEGTVSFGVDGDVWAVLGDVTVAADTEPGSHGGQVVMADGAQIVTTGGDISITADGSVSIGLLSTLNTVSVTSDSGSILDSDTTGVDIIAVNTALKALTGIGTDANGLETMTGLASTHTIAAETDSGDIHIANSGSLTIGTVGSLSGIRITDNSGIGSDLQDSALDNITLSAASPLTINAAIINNDGGGISLTSANDGGSDDHLTINAALTITGGDAAEDATGNVDLNAGTDLVINADISTDGGGTFTGLAARDVQLNTGTVSTVDGDHQLTATAGAISMTDGTSLHSVTGDITASAQTSVAVSSLTTAGDVSVTATTGAISDSGDSAIDISGSTATLSAATGSGSGNALETSVATLHATNSASGTIEIAETDSLAIDVISNGTRDVTVSAGGSITDANAAAVNVTAGTFTVDAAGSIDLDTTISQLDATTSAAGAIDITETDAVELSSVNTADGAITVLAGGTITAVNVDSSATDNDANDITLTTTGGDILVNLINAGAANDVQLSATGAISETSSDAGVDLLAGDAVLTSATGIGSGDALETTLNRLAFSNGTAGDVQITNSQTLTVAAIGALSASTNANGNIEICVTAGDLMVDSALSAVGSTIRLGAANNISQSAAGTISSQNLGVRASGNILLNAAAGGNNVDNVFAAESTTAGDILFADNGGFTVGTVAAAVVNVGDCFSQTVGVTTNSGNVQLTSTGGNLVNLNNITANGAGNITLTTLTSGEVILTGTTIASNNTVTISSIQSINGSGLITADTVDLDAVTGIGNTTSLELAATTITADTTNGNIDLDNALSTATAVGSLTTGSGTITFDQSGGGTVSFDTVTTIAGTIDLENIGSDLTIQTEVMAGGSGDVKLTTSTAGDVVLTGVVTATSDSVTINSADKIIGDTTDADADIIADSVVLNAVNGIGTGSGHAIETTVNSLQFSNTNSGDVNIANTTGLAIGTSSNIAGNIELCVAAGSLAITGLLTAGTNTIRLQADAGSVTETGSGRITTGQLGVKAQTDITLAAATNNVSTFAAASVTGSILLNEADGFTVGTVTAGDCFDGAVGVTTPGAGNVTLHALAGSLQIDDVVTSNSGNVDIDADAGSLNINAGVSSSSGNIDITADTVNQNSDITTSAAGTIRVTADTASIVMADGTSTSTATGTIQYQAADSVDVTVLNSDSGDLTVTAATGSISDVSSSEDANLAASGRVTLTAATGIGSTGSGDIDTNIDSLTATNSTSGDIVIQESDELVIAVSGISTNGGNGNISLDVDAGDVTINVSADVSANGSGVVSINVDSGQLTANADIASSTGSIDITADSFSQNANISTAGSGTIDVVADNGSIVMADGTRTDTAGGAIRYEAALNVAVSRISSTGSTVDITATGGSITDQQAGEGSGSENIVATTATLTAAGDIGTASDDLDTAVDTLIASGTVVGTIQIAETDAVDLQDTQTANGDIEIVAGGRITATSVRSITDSDANDIRLISTGAGIEVVEMNSGTTGDVILDAQNGSITNSGPNPDVVADNLTASATGSIALDTTIATLTATATAPGDISINETDSVELTSVTTADGSVTVVAGSDIVAVSVDAGGGAGDSVFLTATTGDITAVSVTAADSVQLDAVTGSVEATSVLAQAGNVTIHAQQNVTATSVTATVGDVQITADAGDVLIDTITASGANADVSITATAGSVLDSTNSSAVNISAGNGGTVNIVAGADIGAAGTDVLKSLAANPVEIDSAVMNLTASGIIAVHQTSSTVVNTLDAGAAGTIFLSSDGDIDVSASTPTAENLALLTPTGTITLPTTISAVTGDLRIEAADVAAAGGVIDLNATRILFKSGQSEEINITAQQFDGETTGDLTVNSDSAALELADLDCDLTAIDVGSNIAVLNQTVAATVTQVLPIDSMQMSRILSGSLVLNGQGTFDLTNAANDTDLLAGSNVGAITFRDADDVTIDTVDVVTNSAATIVGLSSGSNDIQLDVGTTLTINQQLNADTADTRLQSYGNITQSATGIITADELGIHQRASSGNIQLAAQNDVNILAAENSAAGGSVTFADRDELTIGQVSGSIVSDSVFAAVTGITTTNGNITLDAGVPRSGPDSLAITQQLNAGTADVRLIADGNMTQTATGTITGNSLGVRQESGTGDVLLDDGNTVNSLAVLNEATGGQIAFRNTQPLTIDTVSEQNVAADPVSNAVSFSETSGLETTDGDILLNIDGSLTVTQQLNSGTADVRVVTDGTMVQSATGTITAGKLGIRQQGLSGDVLLGSAPNDVDVIAVSNVAEGGSVTFFDADDLTVASVADQQIGNLTFTATTGVDTNAGDISITAENDLTVTENINAAHNTLTDSIDESITLISRSGDFVLADNTIISSDENPAPGVFDDLTGDQMTIIAGSSGGSGVVNLGSNIEVRTDGGVARQIAPRPAAFAAAPTSGAETAFVTLSDSENMRSNLTFSNGGFLGILDLVFGLAGEENLEVVIDWGATLETSPVGIAGDATALPSGELQFDLTDADKAIFYIDAGGQEYLIPHVYRIIDLVTTANDRNGRQDNPGIFGVRFSVAQHDSIQIWGSQATNPGNGSSESVSDFTGTSATITDAAGQAINPAATALALLSSTDTNNLRDFSQQAAPLPFDNVDATSTGVPEGQAEWEFVAGPSPGIVPMTPAEVITIDIPRIEAPIDRPVVTAISTDIDFGTGAASDAAIGTDVYLQIRRYFEVDADAEVVMARITDSTFISSREAFELFVQENPELQDGAGYEVWLITETSGQRVERPIVKFEITGGRPGPATQELPDTAEPLQLKEMEFEQPSDSDGPQVPPADPNRPQTQSMNDEPPRDQPADPSASETIGEVRPQVLPDLPVRAELSAVSVAVPEADVDPAGADLQGEHHGEVTEVSAAIPGLIFGAVAKWKRRQQPGSSFSRGARAIRKMEQYDSREPT